PAREHGTQDRRRRAIRRGRRPRGPRDARRVARRRPRGPDRDLHPRAPMSEPEPPAEAPPLDPESSEEESAPFLASETSADAAASPEGAGAVPGVGAPASASRGFAFQVWPFLAAGALVAFTLLSVYVLLHPRRSAAAGADEGAPGTVTVDE